MTVDIQLDFLQKAAENFRLKKVVLVGAEYEADSKRLCENDRNLLRTFVTEMNHLKVPVSGDLAAAINNEHDLSKDTYEIVNVDPAYDGGKDFAIYRGKGDAVIFCHIPLGNPERAGPDEKDMPAWQKSLELTGAKIAWISGSDSFNTAMINENEFISLQADGAGQSYLVRKSYFEDMHDHLLFTDSPMVKMIPEYENNVTSFASSLQRNYSRPDEWNKLVIRPLKP